VSSAPPWGADLLEAVLTGKVYRLKNEVAGVLADGPRLRGIKVPAGAVVEVLSGPVDPKRTLRVLWNGMAVALLAESIEQHGEEIDPPT
jgi:hypothetical protein